MTFKEWINPWRTARNLQARLDALRFAESEAGKIGLALLAENDRLKAQSGPNLGFYQALNRDADYLERKNKELREHVRKLVKANEQQTEMLLSMAEKYEPNPKFNLDCG